MRILIVGLNHKTAEVEVREKLAFDGAKLQEGIHILHSLPEINEIVVLSTCNRVELYASVTDPIKAKEAIKNFISEFHGIEHSMLETSLYFHADLEGAHHAFRVASSLDSMVVGEPQILGQLKDAFDFALKHKTTGVILNKLMKKSISVAKRVRTETKIAESAVSISFAAVELARKIFTDLTGKLVMLLGAGEMAELAAKHLMNNGVKEIVVANRTFARGCELAKEMDGRAVEFNEFINEMVSSDIVICSTGASDYVVKKDQMQAVMKLRKQQPMFMIDISVPRNLDPEINDIPNVFLYDVDNLNNVVDTNKEARDREAAKAEELIDEEVETFKRWLGSLDSVPTIIALRQKAEAIKNDEIAKFNGKLSSLDEKDKKIVMQLATNIVNKLIHPPTAALKHDTEDKDVLIATLKRLYELTEEDKD